MKVAELRDVIDRIRALYTVDGTKSTLKGLADFSALLKGRDSQDVEELIADLERINAPVEAVQTVGDAVDQVGVQRHLRTLDAAGLERSAFEKALTALRNDRAIGDLEADFIFKRYHGGDDWLAIYGDKPRWRKRSDAIKAIETSFLEKLTREQKLRTVERSSPW